VGWGGVGWGGVGGGELHGTANSSDWPRHLHVGIEILCSQLLVLKFSVLTSQR